MTTEKISGWVGECTDFFDGKFIFNGEAFAAIIAKECATICRQQGNEYALEFDRENCAAAIEEYFGIIE
jgi:hypothetical protein